MEKTKKNKSGLKIIAVIFVVLTFLSALIGGGLYMGDFWKVNDFESSYLAYRNAQVRMRDYFVEQYEIAERTGTLSIAIIEPADRETINTEGEKLKSITDQFSGEKRQKAELLILNLSEATDIIVAMYPEFSPGSEMSKTEWVAYINSLGVRLTDVWNEQKVLWEQWKDGRYAIKI